MTPLTSCQAALRITSIQGSHAISRQLCTNCCVPPASPKIISRRSAQASAQRAAARLLKRTPVAPWGQAAEDSKYMALALQLAEKAARLGEVPVGAVLVSGGKIISRAHNLVETRGDPTAHAELLTVRQAAMRQGGRFLLKEATLYVTLEPCAMCAGAILLARVGALVYGARSTLLGADGSWASLLPPPAPEGADDAARPCCAQDGAAEPAAGGSSLRPHAHHPDLQVRRGVRAGECAALLQRFFQQRRLENKGRGSKRRFAAVPGLWTALKRSLTAALYRF